MRPHHLLAYEALQSLEFWRSEHQKKVREMFSKDSGNACAKPWEAAGLTIYIYIYMYMHVCIWASIYSICACGCTYMYVYIYAFIYVSSKVCIYTVCVA